MKNTRIISINPEKVDTEKLKEAALILRNGGTVAFPTETVYGLGANALDEGAVKKIFEAKGRPSDNPLIVHVSEIEDIGKLVADFPQKARVLADRFWPGPLTLIFKKSKIVPDVVTAGLDTVAVRIPSHPVARSLIKLAGVPVAAPSANLSGKPSPTEEKHVIEDLKGRVDAIVCGGDCKVGVESTVLDITASVPIILRPGGITLEQLKDVLKEVEIDPALFKSNRADLIPKSPGMKYTHYSPDAEVIVVKGETERMIKEIERIRKEREEAGYKVGIMATEETKEKYTGDIIISVGSRNKPDTIATNLFKVLREFDERGVDLIISEAFEEKGIGQAIMNRLIKAAGYKVIEV